MSQLLSAHHVRVIRQDKAILKDVSIEVGTRDFVTIIGPNGAGKTMLLKCLAGLVRPDSGTISQQAGLKIGYMPQRFVPDASMPMTAARFLRLLKPTSRERFDQVTHQTGIVPMLDGLLHELSGGELQRLLLARALLGDPQLLMLDEPAQNLDVAGQLAFYTLLEQLHHEQGISILMVSHDLHLVMASSRRVICLFKHVCCEGTAQAVAQDPEFISLFGHDMARMMAVYHHHHDHTHADHTHCEEHGHVHA